MSVEYYEALRRTGLDYADPVKVTETGRMFHNANSRGVATYIVAKTSNGLLFGFTVSSIAAQFVQVFDATALPAEGAVPTIVFPVAATSSLPVQFVPPRWFEQGIVLCASSTQHTKTIAVAADTIFDVQFL